MGEKSTEWAIEKLYAEVELEVAEICHLEAVREGFLEPGNRVWVCAYDHDVIDIDDDEGKRFIAVENVQTGVSGGDRETQLS